MNMIFRFVSKIYSNLELLGTIQVDLRSSIIRTSELSKGDRMREETKMNWIFKFVSKFYSNHDILGAIRVDLRSPILTC